MILALNDSARGAGMALEVSDAASETELTGLLKSDAERGFDVRSDLPLRARLIRIGSSPREWVLHLVMHHIASDGASLAPLALDLSAAYEAALGGHAGTTPAPLPLQYADYAQWQRQQLDGDALTAKLDHWRHTLAGIPAELLLPADHRRPRESRQPGRQLGFGLDSASVQALSGLASTSNASLFMALHAVLAGFLHRSGAGDDLVIGSPTAGRVDPALSDAGRLLRQHSAAAGGRIRRRQPADPAGPLPGQHPRLPSTTTTCRSNGWSRP